MLKPKLLEEWKASIGVRCLKRRADDVSNGMLTISSEDLVPESGESVTEPDVKVLGDWVLFHPVYTEDELRAVKVCTASGPADATITNAL